MCSLSNVTPSVRGCDCVRRVGDTRSDGPQSFTYREVTERVIIVTVSRGAVV